MFTTLTLTIALMLQVAPAAPLNDALLEAARTGNNAQVVALLDKGADVNAKARYDMTPLMFAASNGHLDVARTLVARGAQVNAVDSFYKMRPADLALVNRHSAIAIFLLQSGAGGADSILMAAADSGDLELAKAALRPEVSRETLQTAMSVATNAKRTEVAAAIKAALDARPAAPAPPAVAADPSAFPRYAGTYRDSASGLTITVTADNGALMMQIQGQPPLALQARADGSFGVAPVPAFSARFGDGNPSPTMAIVQGPVNVTMPRVDAAASSAAGAAPAAAAAPGAASAATIPPSPSPTARTAAKNWPSFRGDAASGNGDGQGAVSEWDVASGKNIKWKTPIPGIANSSPVVWGNRIFVTTAISKAGDNTFKTGAYGDVTPVDDLSSHEWRIYCLDKASGKVLWQRVASSGAPKTKRHTKGTQANSTPATDGRRVVAAFGSAGVLVAWDLNGKQLWSADLGKIDSGWFLDPSYQWGHASSPIIYGSSVILQADMQKGAYIAAWDLATGKQLWKTARPDEISTWGTPALARTADGRDELVTNGTKIRGYDPKTGALKWTLGPNSEVTVATPVVGHGLVFVTGGYPPVRPIYAVRPGGQGDISLSGSTTSSAAIGWSNSTEGTYIPTPLVYGDRLFTLNNNGVVTIYDARSGERVFRGRVGSGGTFSASPVAADGRLYVTSEDGEVYVVAAAPGLAQIARNDMKAVVMATPAISDGMIIVRAIGFVFGIGE
jgi:outer membrane protein assembly factor BamB